MSSYAGFLIIGGMAGVLSGVFGVGGGIIIVPALVLVTGLSQYTANGTSLVALLPPVGFLGVLEYYRAGKIGPDNIRAGIVIAVGLFVGAYFGSRLALMIPEALLRKCFAVLLLIIAFKFWFSK